jgi:signal peptidase I
MPEMIQTREDGKLSLACDILRSGGTLRLQALGTSMLPCIWPGDVLTLQSISGDDITVGDVVLFVRAGRFFVHRVVRKEGSGWITRGDAVPQNDPPVEITELLGTATSIQRNGRVITPRRPNFAEHFLARLLCHSDFCRNLFLRLGCARLPDPPGEWAGEVVP